MIQWCCNARGSLLLAQALALCLFVGVPRGKAAEASLSPYVIRTWQTEDGLPQNAITSVMQSKDGYLWIGTYSGLARFDGVRFHVFNSANTPALRSGRITSLFEDPAGTLWIGSEIGELTACDPGPRFRAIDISSHWGRRKIIALVRDQAADLWLGDAEGNLMRLKDGVRLQPKAGAATNLVILTSDGRGKFWVVRNGKASSLEQGRLVSQFGGDSSAGYVQGICSSRQGSVWVASEGKLRLQKADSTTEDFGAAAWDMVPLTALLETSTGLLAAGTQDHGLFIVRPGGAVLRLCRTNGLTSDWISSLCEDREGNLWAGTGGNGLIMVRPGNVTALVAPDQWQGRPVLSLTSGQHEALWVGTEGAGLYRWRDGVWSHFGLEAGLGNLFVWSMCEDALGRLWVGTWGGGLLVRHGEHFAPIPAAMERMPAVTALLSNGPDDIWAGTQAGLLHGHAGKWDWLKKSGSTTLSDVRCVAVDKEGTVWFGMLGEGLGCLGQEGVRLLRKSDGLSSDFIQCLHLDGDGSLWIGTGGGGLNRLKNGRFSAIGTAQGLSDDIICWMEEDGLGYLWVSSHAGIMRLSQQELNQCADGHLPSVHCFSFGKEDGLPTLEFSGGLQPAGCKTTDGRLWFASSKGVAVVDPAHVKLNSLAPPVVIEAVQVDGRGITGLAGPSADKPLRIEPGRHRLEFAYTALSFCAPEKVRFRYRLEGLDREWTEAGGKRSASFDYVPPGPYAFHVLACNDAGVWNQQGATVAFELLPYFWQTWWFGSWLLALALGAVGAAVSLETRRRMRRKMEIMERQKAIELERSRIARDIHDELGSHLTRITMLSEPSRHEPGISLPGTKDVRQIYDIARDLTRTMDEIVWAVNPHHDTPEGLVNYLEQFALEFLGAADIRCRLDLPMQLPAWPLTAETRHSLFLAFKEALHNAVKHAGATEVRLALNLTPQALTLSVEDNGRGFVAAAPAMSGNGLENMRRRLQQIGGVCEIAGAPGRGVKIVFVVPMRAKPAGRAPALS